MARLKTVSQISLALMVLTWWAAAAPLELTGAYTTSTEFVTAASFETSTRPGAMLELRLTLGEAGGVLTGFRCASAAFLTALWVSCDRIAAPRARGFGRTSQSVL